MDARMKNIDLLGEFTHRELKTLLISLQHSIMDGLLDDHVKQAARLRVKLEIKIVGTRGIRR